MTTWESVGNSNWYIGVIILCYGLTWLVFRILPVSVSAPRSGRQFAVMLAMSILMVLVLRKFRPACWYNTLLLYDAGIAYSIWRDKVEVYCMNKWAIVGVLGMVGFALTGFFSGRCYGLFTLIRPFFFMSILIVLTREITFHSQSLKWLGAHLFPIYIYQRLPMIVLSGFVPSFPSDWPILFYLSCLVITLLLAWCYKWWRVAL